MFPQIRLFLSATRFAMRQRGLRIGTGLVIKGGKWMRSGPRSVIGNHVEFHANGKGTLNIGSDARVLTGVVIRCFKGKVEIGDHVSLNPYCVIYGDGGVTIGNEVRIATHTVIVAQNHNIDDLSQPIRMQGNRARGIRIGNDVWIGANVTVLDGADIGDGCVIGAGSVVRGTIPPFSIAVGTPARVIRKRGEKPQ